jgi:hypothetical protein
VQPGGKGGGIERDALDRIEADRRHTHRALHLRLHHGWTFARDRIARCVACGIGLAFGDVATAAETTNEFWPELQAWWRLNSSTQLLFNPAPTHSRDSDDRTAVEWGLYVDYRVPKDPISYRLGYVYSVSNPDASSRSIEHRIVMDFNYRWKIGEAGLLTDRTRLDLRDKEGSTSQRLRNRVQYEYESKLGEFGFVPYSNFELYYDTRYDTIARYKFELGATFIFSPEVELTPYYSRQTDTQPERQYVNAFGLMLALRF